MSAARPASRIWIGLAVSVAAALLGCAPKTVEPLPAHPFPSWVAQLETGRTEVDAVLARFGEPDTSEESVRGGTVWHYRFPEIHWADDDPMRPEVAADGSLRPPEPSWWAPIGEGFARVDRFLDRLLHYPPTQPRPPRRRPLPATIHTLELHFAPDGVLKRVRYTPEWGETWVSVAH